MVFHKANKLSSNITWIHSKTLNVIPYFQDKALHGRAACCATSVQSWHKWWTHVLSIRVEPSIIKHVLIIEQFPIFSTFLNQTEQFLCPWMCKLRATNIFSASEIKEQLKKHRMRLNNSLLQKIWKTTLDPSLVPTPYLPLF
jgi:hypothetical protein